MAKPTQSIFPIENGKLLTALDANNFPIHNLDVANSEGIGTGSGGGVSHSITFVGSYDVGTLTANEAVFLAEDIGATISGGALPADTFIVSVTSSTVVQISDTTDTEADVTLTFDRLPAAGNDTGTTTAILKGDGNHGFADAVAGTDYATAASVNLKEDITSHDADITTLTDDILTTQTNTNTDDIALKANTADVTASLLLKLDVNTFESYQASNDSAVALKADQADLDALSDVVDLQAWDSDLQAYIVSNDAAVALKADTTYVDDGLATKASTSDLATSLSTKEPTLPTTANDAYILARHNAGAGGTWYFVDPLTLGTTSQTFHDGVEDSTTTLTSASANFVANDVGKAITGDNIPAATTIASRTNSTTIVLSQAATSTSSGNTFTIVNRIEISGSGTVTSTSATNTGIDDLITVNVSNPTTTPVIALTKPAVLANTFYGSNIAGNPVFMSAATSRTALGGTTVGQALFQLANPGAVGYIRTTALNAVEFRTTAQTLIDLGAESTLTFSTPLARSTNTISISQASNTIPGFLTSTDWNTFNSKASSAITLTTTAPLTGGGDLTANRTLAMPAATTGVSGYLTGTDWTTFNSKLSSTRTITTTAPLTGGGDLSANRLRPLQWTGILHKGTLILSLPSPLIAERFLQQRH